MAHKIGPAKPPIETKTARKGILVGLAMIVFSIALPLFMLGMAKCGSSGSGGYTQPQPEPNKPTVLRDLPKSAAPVLCFEKGQRSVTVQLRADMWSREIETPDDSRDYRITVEPRIGCLVLFNDGTVEEFKPGQEQLEVNDFGIRRGIFRLLGNSNGQTATVTISY